MRSTKSHGKDPQNRIKGINLKGTEAEKSAWLRPMRIDIISSRKM